MKRQKGKKENWHNPLIMEMFFKHIILTKEYIWDLRIWIKIPLKLSLPLQLNTPRSTNTRV